MEAHPHIEGHSFLQHLIAGFGDGVEFIRKLNSDLLDEIPLQLSYLQMIHNLRVNEERG